MKTATERSDIRVKVVGANGQISLGKEFAGKQVMVEQVDTGVWLIRTARIVPDNEAVFHTKQAKADLDEAMTWAAKNKPRETDLATFEKGLDHGSPKTTRKRRKT
ncbi:MAG: hypothetical protein ACOY33_07050 [Pseudomonadota bacterium]